MRRLTDEQLDRLDGLRRYRLDTNEHSMLRSKHRQGPANERNMWQRLRDKRLVASHRLGHFFYHRLTYQGAKLLDVPRSYVGRINDRGQLMKRFGVLDVFTRRLDTFTKLTRAEFDTRFPEQSAAFNRRHERDAFFIDRSEPGLQRLGAALVHQGGNPRAVTKRLVDALPRSKSWVDIYAAGRFSIALIAAGPQRARELRRSLNEVLTDSSFFSSSWPPVRVHLEVVGDLLQLADRTY